MAAAFLSQVSSFIGRTSISANYTFDENSPPSQVGLWKVYKATRNAGTSAAVNTGRQNVSVWVHKLEARGREREAVVEQAKKEASAMTRLRHPCVLEVVEPLEETRYELTFATEQIVAPLQEALHSDSRNDIQLDEVETQKGLLQVARGLEFLHDAKMVHSNLTPDAVLINAKGDWKIGGFAFLTPLQSADGRPTAWTFPDYNAALPAAMSRHWDYMAPEYAIDEKLEMANDMYALGCIIFAVHNKGSPPFRNRNSAVTLRQNADELSTVIGSTSWARMGADVLSILSSLLTRYPVSRLTAKSFQKSNYFNNILVSTLKFMERDNFAGRQKEERVQFLKGLMNVLPQFSDRLLRRKMLPALLELMSDRSLLPFILPNVFYISKNLSMIEFSNSILPKLQPLFQIQDPPQNLLLLLEQIELFVTKTSPSVFREGVTPLLYSSLESEHATVQERALKVVPRLCEILEYSHVKEVLFPKIAALFTRTKVLSVKCNTLICFHSMIAVLDKYTLTEKLVPLLSRIKTKEPSVMIATLAVYEVMSKKVDRETLGSAIIPQLWTMSMGPLLNADQFVRFMKAVKEMGTRVESEHLQHLKEVKRMQEHTDSYVSGQQAGGLGRGVTNIDSSKGEIDFATLIGSAHSIGKEIVKDKPQGADPFGLDEFDTLTSHSSTPLPGSTPALTPSHTGSNAASASSGLVTPAMMSNGASLTTATASRPGISPVATSAFRVLQLSAPPSAPSASSLAPTLSKPLAPSSTGGSRAVTPTWTSYPLAPTSSNTSGSNANSSQSSYMNGASNYNISLSSQSTQPSMPLTKPMSTGLGAAPLPPLQPSGSSLSNLSGIASVSGSVPSSGTQGVGTGASRPVQSPGWGTVLTPSKAPGAAAENKQNDWSDFDPLR
ncbi:kinase-like protein [Tilletiaria anomala UBC 951]|uniref:Kinase-like protein n=1 Tax=Tilletiaria anomala (strain ATCC 24038 / CBS 436.72 / UBC 951) TaxID=1037660 RepID=A0A066W6A1_TILAU|nr:kinase-like protein [Tilletiaria anomala UBC 951]KDN46614.1 kinase-like protein [Tilletiaria anomala UBC 951]